jgi:pimeloyl-ACP methyl ester carboxylesterase
MSIFGFFKSVSPVNKQIFPKKASSYDSDTYGDEMQEMNGTHCLVLKHDNLDECRTVLIYLHGNYEDVGDCYALLRDAVHEWRTHVIAAEFPGYGISPGQSTEESVNAAALNAFRLAIQLFGNGDGGLRVVVCGRSVGSGPAVWLASGACANKFGDESRAAIAGLVTISAFSSFKRLASSLHVLGNLAFERWDSLASCPKLTCPALFIHGALDNLISPEQSQALAQAAPFGLGEFFELGGADHNEGLFDRATDEKIREFVQRVAPSQLPVGEEPASGEVAPLWSVIREGAPVSRVAFVHGFNNTAETIDRRRALLESAFVHHGVGVAVASWSSVAGESQARSVNVLRPSAAILYSIDNTRTADGGGTPQRQVHSSLRRHCDEPDGFAIVAHSRGCHLVVEWLLRNEPCWSRVRRVALLHPDVNRATLSRLLDAGFVRDRVAVFDSGSDVATSVSGSFGMVAEAFSSRKPSGGSRDVGSMVGHHQQVSGTSHSHWLSSEEALATVARWIVHQR